MKAPEIIETAIFQFFSLVRQRLSKAYALNCSCFATGAQNALYITSQFFGFMRFSGWTCKSNRYFSNLFKLVQQRMSKAYAINCSCFATGAQKTLYNQKKERTN